MNDNKFIPNDDNEIIKVPYDSKGELEKTIIY